MRLSLPLPAALGELGVLLVDEWPPPHLRGAPWDDLEALFADVMEAAPDEMLPPFARSGPGFGSWCRSALPFVLMGWLAGACASGRPVAAGHEVPGGPIPWVCAADVQALLAEHGVEGLCRLAGFDVDNAIGSIRWLMLARVERELAEVGVSDPDAAIGYLSEWLAVLPVWVLLWMLLGAHAGSLESTTVD